jgi:hypothetical protein
VSGQWYAAVREVDVTGISGCGIIAWAYETNHGFLMFWDTILGGGPTETMEWFDTIRKFDTIHGHGGCTKLKPVDTAHADRGRELMDRVFGRVMATMADVLVAKIADGEHR